MTQAAPVARTSLRFFPEEYTLSAEMTRGSETCGGHVAK